MRLWQFALGLVAACGRVGFDRAGDDAGRLGDGPLATDSTQVAIPPGAGFWLQMETDPNAGIIDSVGGHAVSCTGACPTRVAGVHGGGYKFTAELLRVAFGPELSASAGYTAAFWIKLDVYPATSSASSCPYGLSFNPTNGWDTIAVCLRSDGSTFFDCETPTGTQDLFDGPIVSLHAWHHVVQTWDGTMKRGYIDGLLVGEDAVQIGTGTEDFEIGGGPGYELDGSLDDVVYYPRALSQLEITQLATP